MRIVTGESVGDLLSRQWLEPVRGVPSDNCSRSSRSMVLTTFLVAAARFGASLGSLGLIFIVSRLYPIEAVGAVSLMIASSIGISTLARLGFDVSAIKYLPPWIAAGRNDQAAMFLARFAVRTVAILVLALTAFWVFQDHTGIARLSTAIMACALTVLAFLSALVKSALRPVAAAAFEPGYSLLVSAAVLVALHVSSDTSPSTVVIQNVVAGVVATYAVIGCLAVAIAGRTGRYPTQKLEHSVDYRAINIESVNFFLIAVVGYFYSQGYVWLAGQYFDLATVGFVAVVARLAFGVNFSLMIANAIYNPRFAIALNRGSATAVEVLAGRSLRTMVSLSLIPGIVLICLPQWVLGLFNIESDTAETCLVLMSFAQVVNVVTGNAASILNLGGEEKVVRNNAILHLGVALAMTWSLVPHFGVIALVGSCALAIASQNVMLVAVLWRRRRISLYRYAF